jgi:hypothetical protein
MDDVATLLAAYDEQMRPAEVVDFPAGVHAERDGPIVRVVGQHGARYLQVDASDDSRPILQRLGLVAVTTTTPYVWTPEVA